jgi:hydrogenase/urease accessory protein HupE
MGRAATSAIASYALAGAAHLVTGLDHVLFLIGLLLLVKRARALFFAVTAFTAAHSLSLALQVLGAVRLPPAPVEAAIALSVLFVARELLRPPDRRTLAQRRPYVVTFAFGLLHGLGFAGGLAAMEVPRAEVPAALFGFNIGLEAAQIGLVLVALAVGRALRAGVRALAGVDATRAGL